MIEKFKKSGRGSVFFSLLDFLVFSNVWIAFGAFSMYLATSKFIFDKTNVSFESLQVFGATLFAYNLLRFKSLNHSKFKQSPIAIWMNKNKSISSVLMVIGFLLASVPFFMKFYNAEYFLTWGLLILLTLLYLLVRKFWFLKTFFVALVWSLATLILPISLNSFDLIPTLFLFIGFIFFYLSITLPFEIRDMKYDNEEGPVLNFSLRFGYKTTKFLSIIFSILALIFFLLTDVQLGLTFLLISIFTILIVLKTRVESSEYVFTFLFDGLIVLFALAIYNF